MPVGSSRVGLSLTLQMPRWPLDFEQRGSREQGAEPVSMAPCIMAHLWGVVK